MADRIMELGVFLEAANEGARARIFDKRDYENFKKSRAVAKRAAKKSEAFISSDYAGSVPNAYKYSATSAAWHIYTHPDGTIVEWVGRKNANNNNVKCAFLGGDKKYFVWFKTEAQKYWKKQGVIEFLREKEEENETMNGYGR